MTSTPIETLAFRATLEIHRTIVNDPGFAGYEEDGEHFYSLLQEVLAVVNETPLPQDRDPEEFIIESWFEIQNEIAEAKRDTDWYLGS